MEPVTLSRLHIDTRRNAYGPAAFSFTAPLQIPSLKNSERPFPGVFIRAPIIESVGDNVDVIATVGEGKWGKGGVVGVKEGSIWGTAFHPELTSDTRFHEAWIDQCVYPWKREKKIVNGQ